MLASPTENPSTISPASTVFPEPQTPAWVQADIAKQSLHCSLLSRIWTELSWVNGVGKQYESCAASWNPMSLSCFSLPLSENSHPLSQALGRPEWHHRPSLLEWGSLYLDCLCSQVCPWWAPTSFRCHLFVQLQEGLFPLSPCFPSSRSTFHPVSCCMEVVGPHASQLVSQATIVGTGAGLYAFACPVPTTALLWSTVCIK